MSTQAPVPQDSPLMIAWKAYKATPEYANALRWGTYQEHTEGSLWAAFEAGFNARPQPPSLPDGEETGPSLTETIASAAVEIVAECREMLGLPRGAQLTEAVRWIAGGGPDAGLWEEYDAMAEEYWACIRRDDMLAADSQRKLMDEQQQRIRASALRASAARAGAAEEKNGSDAVMLLVWEAWAKKEGNEGAAALFRRAAENARRLDWWEAQRTNTLAPVMSAEGWRLHEADHLRPLAVPFRRTLRGAIDEALARSASPAPETRT